ncbi:pentatricopeptide repeat-containing protein At3g49740 [Elaeis guineensis]|uniref:Pentatricopeptide repeat-containing protein At3g49740 n=1 Tax=Elaeis guineensis var. tenera TaxID=51953 RepID=A0A6I9RCA0_ELAGV|nr:pentatricopeptide repeat-containing protein At3g49740 [Elaeis guineensis]
MKCPTCSFQCLLPLPSNLTQNPTQLLITLNALLSKLTRSHRCSQALCLFSHIHASYHISPDHYSLASALAACARLRAATAGAQLHSLALRSALLSFTHVANSLLSFYANIHGPDPTRHLFGAIPNPDVYSYTTLISAYAKAGRFQEAVQLFDGMPKRNTAAWNAMITGFVHHGYEEFALKMFLRMHRLGVGLDKYTFASVMGLCGSPELVSLGRQLHSMVIKTGILELRVSVINALVTMYFDCGLVMDAWEVFGEAMVRDEITYNALIAGLVRLGRDVEALMVFKEMKKESFLLPTELTFASVLSACLSREIGTQVHAQVIRMGLEDSVLVANAVVTMYSNCGDLVSAEQAFEMIHEKDIVSWNALITGYSQENCYEPAVGVYHQMQKAGIEPDEFTYGSLLACSRIAADVKMIQALVIKNGFITSTEDCNAIISAYAKCGEIASSYQVFNEMPSRNIISWNSIISGYVLSGFPVRSLEIFSALIKSRLMPNSYTLSTVLSTCATMPARKHGKEVHAYILRDVTKCDTLLMNSLVTMYGKCGELDYGSKVFDGMLQRDIVSWNVIISAYAQNGDGHEAIHYFKMMQKSGIIPDNATFTSVLSACSHAGLVEEGRVIFTSMVQDYGIEPGVDHYSCIIDLLGRAGYLEEAERLINSMPCRVDSHIWWALLSACSTHGNARLGRIAAKFLLETEPENPTIYVLLSNIIAADGKWEEASSLRDRMQRNGVAKKPGCSWIEDIQSTTDSW